MRGRSLYPLLVLVLSLAFTFIFYGKVLLAPNGYLFSDSGDGIKNYYTYAWHIKYDSSLVNFGGMNYPYGEHFLYTDCHPLLTMVFRALTPVFAGLPDYSVGILNFFLLLTFMITALFLWLIFREFKVDPWIAVLASIGIMMLSPQVFRLTGHLALAYSYFIPVTFYITLRYYRNPLKKRWLWLQMVNMLYWFFIHAYLGMIAVGFLFAFWLIHYGIHFKELKRSLQAYLPLLLWVIVPVLFFFVFTSLTDTHTGRTNNPSGFFLNNAEPDDLLVPQFRPLRFIWDSMTKVYQNWEGWSYLGLTTIVVLIFVVIRTVISLVRRKSFIFDKGLLPDHHLRIAVYASLVLLLFAFGMPFKLYPPMTDWFPVVKQFRATGRFAWVFFFMSAIMSVVIIDNMMKRLYTGKWKRIVRIIGLIAILFYGFEAYYYHVLTGELITKNRNYFTPGQYDENLVQLVDGVPLTEYQAILPMPFFYNGSENFKIPGTDLSQRNAFLTSYYTGLPVLGANLTRTGIEESKRIIQVLTPGYYPKPIEEDLPSDKAFLVLKSPEYITPNQEALQSVSQFVNGTRFNVLYRLEPDSLFRNTASEEIGKFEKIQDSLFSTHGFLVTDTNSFLHFDSFDEERSGIVLSPPGALHRKKKDTWELYSIPPGTLDTTKVYVATLWMYNGYQDALNFWLRFMVIEHMDDGEADREMWVLPEQSETLDGNWSLVEITFRPVDASHVLSILLDGKEIDQNWLIADDLLIREVQTDVYRVDAMNNGQVTELFRNNQRIRRTLRGF